MRSPDIDAWNAWREQERNKRRHMTLAEYRVWSRIGDSISDHTSTDAFPGGITIDLRPAPIIGRTSDD